MLMTNENVTLYPHDKVLAKVVLPLIPKTILPNHLTILRFFLTPPVLFFLWREDWVTALAFFLVAGFTDALDGSLARVRKQITLWGTIADPIADKILIGSAVVLFVAKEVNPWFALIIIVIELAIGLGAWSRQRKGVYVSANQYGKIKMVLQVLGVAALIVAKIAGIQLAVQIGVGTLTVAIVFAIVSLLTYGF